MAGYQKNLITCESNTVDRLLIHRRETKKCLKNLAEILFYKLVCAKN